MEHTEITENILSSEKTWILMHFTLLQYFSLLGSSLHERVIISVFLSIPDITSSNEKSVDGNKLCHCGFSRIRTLEDFHHGNKKRTKNNKVIRDPDDSEQNFIPKMIFWIHLRFLYFWCRWWCRNTACGHVDMPSVWQAVWIDHLLRQQQCKLYKWEKRLLFFFFKLNMYSAH